MSDLALESARGYMAEIDRHVRIMEKALALGHEQWAESIADRLRELPLSVMVRDGWRQPGGHTDESPEEFEILLSTGGPATRIYGTIGDHGQAESAELQHQDWFEPWQRLPGTQPTENLIAFANLFYLDE